MVKVLKLNPKETVQLMIDLDLGPGKVRVGDNQKLTYLFPEKHHGCNEMEAGTWKLDARGMHLHISMEYDEAFDILKSGVKPQKFSVIHAEFEKLFSTPQGIV